MIKQRILQTIVALLAIAGDATAQTLSVASIEATAGGQAELEVSASGMAGVTALQFNLALPQGITLNESAIMKGEAVSGHTLSVQTMDSGDRLIVLYHTNLELVGNGTLLRLPITVGQQAGNFSGSLYTVRTANTEAESHECLPASFNITVKAAVQPVTITADNKTMTYGDNVPTLTYKSSGATLSGTPKLSTTATKTSPVGTYPIKVEKGTVTNEQVTYVDGTLTIGKAPLTVGVQNVTITEGDAIPTFTLTYSGFRNNDSETNTFTTKPTATTTATSASKPGTYPITVSGGVAQNYALTYTQGTLTITAKAVQPVTITADNKTMTYGDNVPTLTYKSSGATLSGTPKLSTTATKTSPVGTYPIKVEKGTVTNEQVTYVDGTLTIGKAPLTVGVQNVTITEGDAIPTFTLTYSGWRNNDKEATAFTTKPKATTTATSASKPGTYPITVSGGAAQNYALTYTQGTLTIKEKEKQPIAEGIYELTVEMFHLWDDCTATAKVAQQNGGGESHVGEAVGEGSLIYGVTSVYYLRYADLTDYDKLVIIGTPGMKLRVLMNRKEVGNGGGDENGGSLTEVKPVIGDDGLVVVPLTDNDFAHLNAIKTDWSTPSGTVKRLALVKGNPDMTPLGIDQLSDGLTAKPIIYNLGGQRLEKPRKGINIIGGKKVFVP